jgi:hypothetical protein
VLKLFLLFLVKIKFSSLEKEWGRIWGESHTGEIKQALMVLLIDPTRMKRMRNS